MISIPEIVLHIARGLILTGHQAYIVGGAIRDATLSRSSADWDITTSANLKGIQKVCHPLPSFTLGHGTVTLVEKGLNLHITPLRGRQDDLKQDLAGRDFTVNAMAYDIEKGQIVDPFEGRKDLKGKCIRAVGNPRERFAEDPLRLLRAVRLATELGFQVEGKTLLAMTSMACSIRRIAPERIREEIFKILLAAKPSQGFQMMKDTAILKCLFPELLEGCRMRQNLHHRYTIFRHIMETIDLADPELHLRITALFHDVAKPRVRSKIDGIWRFHAHAEASARLGEEMMDRLKTSKTIRRRVTHLVRHHMIRYDPGWGDAAVRRFIRRVGPANIEDLLSLRKADILAHGLLAEQKGEIALLVELKNRIRRLSQTPVVTKTGHLAIGGKEVMATLKLSEGPIVGRILKILVERVIDEPELNTKERLLYLLKHMNAP